MRITKRKLNDGHLCHGPWSFIRLTNQRFLCFHRRHHCSSLQSSIHAILLFHYFSLFAFASGQGHNQSLNAIDHTNSAIERPNAIKLNLTITPTDQVANCTDIVLTCSQSHSNQSLPSDDDFWWTFRDNNVSTSVLPGGRVLSQPSVSKLMVDCAQLGVHDGEYACHAGSDQQSVFASNVIQLDVHVSIDPQNATIRERLDGSTTLKCHVHGFPKPQITWQRLDESTLKVTNIEPDGRIVINNHLASEHHEQSVLTFKSLQRSDNGTYICSADSTQHTKPLVTQFTVIVLEAPQIHIEKLEIENKTEVRVTFAVDYDGNAGQLAYHLEMINYTSLNVSWNNLAIDPQMEVSNRFSSFQVGNVIAGVTYGFRLSAQNELGRSEWSHMNISVPADVPSPIQSVHLLSKMNESLLFGFTRPLHDNGASITFYNFLLRDENDRMVSNQTLDITGSMYNSMKSKIMYMFPGLKAGTSYVFQVRACSSLGCGEWSPPLKAATSDGYAQPPLNVLLECVFDQRLMLNNASISWRPPSDPRGTITGYNISIEGYAHYKIANNQTRLEELNANHIYDASHSEALRYQLALRPNSNYTVRLAAINNSGWGQFSPITSNTMCSTSPTPPAEYPAGMKLERLKPAIVSSADGIEISPFVSERMLKLTVPRVSERNGRILCYRIVIVRLAITDNAEHAVNTTAELLETDPSRIPLSTYHAVHNRKNQNQFGAYIAEEFSSDDLKSEIMIGDGKSSRCYADLLEYDIKSRIKPPTNPTEDNRTPRRISYDATHHPKQMINTTGPAVVLVEDKELWPHTLYSAFLEVTVFSSNRTLLTGRSRLIHPVGTYPSQVVVPGADRFPWYFLANEISLGVLAASVVIVVVMLSVVCCLKRKLESASLSVIEDEATVGLNTYLRCNVGRRKSSGAYFSRDFSSTSAATMRKWTAKAIPLNKIVEAYQKRHENNDFMFQAEFETLPESFADRTTEASEAPVNACKNRYPDIKSYDQTRVILSREDDDSSSDYINADHVYGYKQKHFICAQGPLDRTIADFWRMIFEQKCKIIVMLTGLEEQGRIKCAQYWSDEKQPKEIGNTLNVSVYHRSTYSDYDVRRMLLHHTPSNENREIIHFHFTGWSDFLAPDQPSWLLRFMSRVNEHYAPDQGPIVVHCSAGVGRTGTFIAIDSLVRQVQDGTTSVNVFQTVAQLRHERALLVQSLKQYIFVYKALMAFVQFGDTEVEGAQLISYYREMKHNDSGVLIEFEKLNDIPEDTKSCNAGSLAVNRAKNRYSFIVPYDINRVVLTQVSKDQQSYINASFIEGYDHSLSFIVAQDPLEHTVNEFWLMVIEHNVRTLVMLSELGEGQSKCHKYWPEDEFDCDGLLKVKLIQTEMTKHYNRRMFSIINKKTSQDHQVEHYQFLAWKSSVVPETSIALITITDLLLELAAADNANKTNASPILVHCSGGGDRSSVFVAFASLVKQLRSEERANIFQTARFIRSQRQGMLQTVAQYDFLYRCLVDYIQYHVLFDVSDTQLLISNLNPI